MPGIAQTIQQLTFNYQDDVYKFAIKLTAVRVLILSLQYTVHICTFSLVMLLIFLTVRQLQFANLLLSRPRKPGKPLEKCWNVIFTPSAKQYACEG